MKFIKSKVFEVLCGYCILNTSSEVRVVEEAIEIYKDSDLIVSYDVNSFTGEIAITFTDAVGYTSDQLEDYLGLLVDLKECVRK